MIPGVAPLILAAAGGLALGIALAILRGFGPRYRVGRLLAVVPRVTVAEALAIARSGERRYVRIDGRIDSEAEFEDQDHRPLVLRRTTFHWRPSGSTGGRGWALVEPPRIEAVPFAVSEGLDEIAIDGEALGDGLVVIPRESTGRVADLGDRAPDGSLPDAQLRLRVEHLSSVEHATVLGVPSMTAAGAPTMAAGLGRPLILTVLEGEEAMRVLTGGAIGRSRLAVACLAAGAVLLGLAAIWFLVEALFGGGTAAALAATPQPTIRPGSDIRSGDAPGFVGAPLIAVGVVAGVALLSVLATLAYVRLTGGRNRH
jgi:hypothetical protein